MRRYARTAAAAAEDSGGEPIGGGRCEADLHRAVAHQRCLGGWCEGAGGVRGEARVVHFNVQ